MFTLIYSYLDFAIGYPKCASREMSCCKKCYIFDSGDGWKLVISAMRFKQVTSA